MSNLAHILDPERGQGQLTVSEIHKVLRVCVAMLTAACGARERREARRAGPTRHSTGVGT